MKRIRNVVYHFLLGLVFVLFVFGVAHVINDITRYNTHFCIREDPILIFTTSDMIRKLNPKIDRHTASYIASEIEKQDYFPSALIVSLIFRESSFNSLAVSSANCIGLMQINPEAHPEKVEGLSREELFHVPNNIRIGCDILKEYYISESDIKGALSRYLGSSNNNYIYDILSNYVNLCMIERAYSSLYLNKCSIRYNHIQATYVPPYDTPHIM